MKIRIQPRDIEVPEGDPFEEDLLGRKEPAEALTSIIGSIEGPCVLALDAGWGLGKTTFLKMWAQDLQNQGFPVVRFNAWETDFTEEPFVALSAELTEALNQWADRGLKDKIGPLAKAAEEVVRRSIPGAVRAWTAGLVDISPIFEPEGLSAYAGAKESIGGR